MNRVLGAVLGAWCVALLACSAPRRMSASAPELAVPAAAGDPRAEIEALDREITDALARAQVTVPATAACTGAACAEAMSQPFATPTTADPACHPASSQSCNDVCTISTSICGNQQKICDLAGQLAGDDWAAHKCERARASCQAAHDRCCSCR